VSFSIIIDISTRELMIKRVGFACMLLDASGQTVAETQCKTTTIAWLNSNPERVEQRLRELMRQNAKALLCLVGRVGKFTPELRMLRLTSDLLTAYDHPQFEWFYKTEACMTELSDLFLPIGDLARKLNVRLSFHPGQFCVLASDRQSVVENSIRHFEKHVDIARYMGYCREFQDFKINVHISGKQGAQGILLALPLLSEGARRCITIENAEYSWGLLASLELVRDVALVFDVHHHWVATGEHIEPEDKRLRLLRESWRGVRPVMHYSVSREAELIGHSVTEKPSLSKLISEGKTTTQLRAHSNWYWNSGVNEWLSGFRDHWDIMCESKMKNLAQLQFWESCNE
jgi:UV DNA damage repair endonuclease